MGLCSTHTRAHELIVKAHLSLEYKKYAFHSLPPDPPAVQVHALRSSDYPGLYLRAAA